MGSLTLVSDHGTQSPQSDLAGFFFLFFIFFSVDTSTDVQSTISTMCDCVFVCWEIFHAWSCFYFKHLFDKGILVDVSTLCNEKDPRLLHLVWPNYLSA